MGQQYETLPPWGFYATIFFGIYMSPDIKIWLLAIMKVVALAAILDFKMAAILDFCLYLGLASMYRRDFNANLNLLTCQVTIYQKIPTLWRPSWISIWPPTKMLTPYQGSTKR